MKKSTKNIKKLLNLNIVDILNNTISSGKYDMPKMYCKKIENIDYIALYTECNLYHNKDTVISFYNYDISFDGFNGLFNAIYYNKENLLLKYKKRFENCYLFISPDYSECGDVHMIENMYRLFKSRIVSIWLTMECNALVIPNITYSNSNMFNFMLQGLEEVETVAFNTKGNIYNKDERYILIDAIKYTVDNLNNLKTIVVYSCCKDDNVIYNIFEYAIKKHIEVIVPNNTLKTRNKVIDYGKKFK